MATGGALSNTAVERLQPESPVWNDGYCASPQPHRAHDGLKEHSRGVVAMSGCTGGVKPPLLFLIFQSVILYVLRDIDEFRLKILGLGISGTSRVFMFYDRPELGKVEWKKLIE